MLCDGVSGKYDAVAGRGGREMDGDSPRICSRRPLTVSSEVAQHGAVMGVAALAGAVEAVEGVVAPGMLEASEAMMTVAAADCY